MSNANWFLALRLEDVSWFDAHVGVPPAGLRRFVPDDLHLTVAFLGPCGEARARDAWTCHDPWREGPVAATLDAVVPMGNPARYSALSATLAEGREQAARLIALMRHPACDAAHAPREARTPKPHVTVARPVAECTAAQRDQGLRWASALTLGGLPVRFTEIALITWARDRQQRQFCEVERARL